MVYLYDVLVRSGGDVEVRMGFNSFGFMCYHHRSAVEKVFATARVAAS